jgi:hypothetical protein
MVLKGQWRFVGGAALGGGLLVLASLAVSPAATADYLTLGPRIGNWLDMPGMELHRACSWAGFWKLLAGGRWPPELVTAVTVASCLATLVPLVWLFRGPLDPAAPRFRVQFAALVLATVALSPYVLSYDLTLLLVPIFLLLAHRPPAGETEDPRSAEKAKWLAALAVLLYGTASVTDTVAAATGVQPVVPVLAAAIMALAWLE